VQLHKIDPIKIQRIILPPVAKMLQKRFALRNKSAFDLSPLLYFALRGQ